MNKETIKKTYQDLLEKRLDLSEYIPGYIWRLSDYEEVLNVLLQDRQLLLGGNMLIMKDGEYSHESSSWYYDGKSCSESIEVAREYLARFEKFNPNDNFAVVFTFKPALDD